MTLEQRPWAPTTAEANRYQLLHHLAQHTQDNPVDFWGSGLTEDLTVEVLNDARAAGLVVAPSATARGGDLPQLTATGREWVGQMSEARGDRRHRRRACRSELLLWLDRFGSGEAVSTEGFLSAPDAGKFYGEPFTGDDLREAASALRDMGLLRPFGNSHNAVRADGLIWMAELTAEGRACADRYAGDADAYYDARTATGSSARAVNINTGGGNFSGQLNVGDNVTMTQSLSPTESTALEDGLAQLRDLLLADDLELEPEARGDLETALEDLENDVSQPEPNRGRLRSRLRALGGAISRAGFDAGVRAAADENVRQLLQLLAAGG